MLFQAIDRQIPELNPEICNGYSVKEFKHVERYVNSIIQGAEPTFPPGLTYLGLRKCTPTEEYLKAIESGGSNSSFDISRSDVYMVWADFEFQGQVISKHIYLPYVRDGGLISLRGSTFVVSAVLADKGVSLGSETVFIQIPKARNMYKRLRYSMMANGIRKTPTVAYSRIHNRSAKKGPMGIKSVKANTTLTHYLFCKYGVKETFRLFCGVDILVGDPEDINHEKLPKDEWVICNTTGIRPRGLKNPTYTPSKIRLAIRECDYDLVTESMITGFFYIADHFPERIQTEFIDSSEYEQRLWRILMGIIVGGVSGGEGAILDDMNEHIASLDKYIDPRAKQMLAEGDIFVDDFYQLLYYVIETLANMVTQTTSTLSSMWDKQLVVLRYVLNDINETVSRLGFRFQKTASRKQLNFSDVNMIIKTGLKTDDVFRMSLSSKHREISSISYSGDNKLFKITTNVVLQSDTGAAIRAKTSNVDKTMLLHSSIAEVGSYTVLPKSEPTGRSRINPWVKIDERGSIIPNSKNKELLDSVQRAIER